MNMHSDCSEFARAGGTRFQPVDATQCYPAGTPSADFSVEWALPVAPPEACESGASLHEEVLA